MPRTGRPSKFDAEKAARIVDLIRGGNYAETAAASAGISKVTFYNWKREGARERDKRQNPRYKPNPKMSGFVEFLNGVEKAEAECEVRGITRIQLVAREEWTAMAWYLERKFPARWGRRNRAEVPTSEDGAAQEITLQDILGVLNLKKLTKEERAQLVGLLRKCGP